MEVKDLRYNTAGDLEVLIQWQHLPEFENSWELASKMMAAFPQFHLENKVVALGGSIDSSRPIIKKVYVRKGGNKGKVVSNCITADVTTCS